MEYDAEQKYQSVVRAFNKLEGLATDIGKTMIVGDHAAADAANSFFIECHHLKDWLKKDSRIKKDQDVEDAITNSPSLSIAADLCNSFKHAGLKNEPRSGKQLEKKNMAYSLDLPASGGTGHIKMPENPSDGDTITVSTSNRQGPPRATARIFFTLGGKKYDAMKIAVGCMADWDTFLVSRGISFLRS